jgi:multidrug efflux pump subunit AcrA (membrane-fusion protein)
MAGPEDWFTPGEWPSLPQVPSIGQMNVDPRLATALIAMGQGIAGPRHWGESGSQQIIGSLGNAGEAIGRQEEMDRKQQEADSKEELRTSQADAATSRARSAQEGAVNASQALDLKKQALGLRELTVNNKINETNRKYDLAEKALELKRDSAKTDQERRQAELELRQLDSERRNDVARTRAEAYSTNVDSMVENRLTTEEGRNARAAAGRDVSTGNNLRSTYNAYKAGIDAANFALSPKERHPVMSFDEYVASRPNPGQAPASEAPMPAIPNVPGPSAATPLPSDSKMLKNGELYATPKGNLYWNATRAKFTTERP